MPTPIMGGNFTQFYYYISLITYENHNDSKINLKNPSK